MFEWRQFLRVAKDLASAPDADEATRRTAIGRAYYACFNLARLYLVAANRMPPLQRRDVHEYVWQQFSSSLNALELKVGQTGFRLRSYRNRADYDRMFPNLARDIDNMMGQAEQLVDTLDRLS